MHARYSELEDGDWRLLWLGRLHAPANNPGGYQAELWFERLGSREEPHIKPLLRPLAELPLWAIRSQWRKGEYDRPGPGTTRVFEVQPKPVTTSHPWRGAQPLFSHKDYYFHKLKDLCDCYTFRTSQKEHLLVVPAWQILQAWYLFSDSVIPAVLAGWLNVEAFPNPKIQPWRHGTSLRDRHVEYHMPTGLSITEAVRFSRLLFDPVAKSRAKRVYYSLLDQRPADGFYKWPMVLPPHSEACKWRVRTVPISDAPTGERRFLSLAIESADCPWPFESFDAFSELMGDQDEVGEVGEPRIIPASPTIPDGTLPLVNGGPRASTPSVSINGFGFTEGLFNSLRIRHVVQEVSPKPRENLAIGEPGGEITGISMDETAVRDKRTAQATLREPGVPPLSPDDLLQRTLEGFQAVVEYVAKCQDELPNMKARLRVRSDVSTFVMHKPLPRHFLILEVVVNGIAVYALDYQRHGPEGYGMAQCRTAIGRAILDSEFERWFSFFPNKGKGNAWAIPEVMPADLLRPSALRHQTQHVSGRIKALPEDIRQEQSHARYVEKLRNRLLEKLTALARSPVQTTTPRSQGAS